MQSVQRWWVKPSISPSNETLWGAHTIDRMTMTSPSQLQWLYF